MNAQIDTVLGIYDAFGRGDVGHILEQLSDDIVWDQGLRSMELPYLQAGVGKGHVMSFFQALATNLEFTTFEPQAPCSSDDTVMVAVREAGRNIVTGKEIPEDLAVHIWTFGPDGDVVSFRHVGDFAVHEAAARVGVTAGVE